MEYESPLVAALYRRYQLNIPFFLFFFDSRGQIGLIGTFATVRLGKVRLAVAS